MYSKDDIRYKRSQGYRCLGITDLLHENYINNEESICWGLSGGNISEFERLMTEKDIVELTELNTIKLAYDFQEPPPKKERIL